MTAAFRPTRRNAHNRAEVGGALGPRFRVQVTNLCQSSQSDGSNELPALSGIRHGTVDVQCQAASWVPTETSLECRVERTPGGEGIMADVLSRGAGRLTDALFNKATVFRAEER